jgi:signal transduction histidine kinase
MTDAAQRQRLHDAIDSAGQPSARLVRQVVHDLRTPLSTFSMEFFTVQLLMAQLRDALAEVDPPPPSMTKIVADLDEIHANLRQALDELDGYVRHLASLGGTPEA